MAASNGLPTAFEFPDTLTALRGRANPFDVHRLRFDGHAHAEPCKAVGVAPADGKKVNGVGCHC